ncbi:MAG: hypothetical protein PVF44_11785 [Syntrophobacterales bacterium]
METRAFRFQVLVIFLLGLMWFFAGCASRGRVEERQIQFKNSPSPHGENRFPNWQFPPQELEKLDEPTTPLAIKGEFVTLEDKRTETGVGGASVTVFSFPSLNMEIKIKWKEMTGGILDSYNNSPRKQIAAYQIQKLFLEPEDYVVPTVEPICFPLEFYNRYRAEPGEPSLPGISCQLGLGSIWMLNVKVPDKLYDESRFLKDYTYAYFMSNFNILAYLIDHRDAKPSNILVSKDENRRQVFSIDNDIAFGEWVYSYFRPHYNKIRVAALRRDSIDRLRRLQRQDLDFLRVVYQMEKDENGVLHRAPVGDGLCPNGGICIKDGTVQFGLKKSEIDDVWERIESLIAEVDSGKIQVF